MNRTRLRAARAKLHEAIDDLFDAIEDSAAAPSNDVAPEPESRPRRRRRRAAPIVKPTGRVKPTDLDMRRADVLLKRHYGR